MISERNTADFVLNFFGRGYEPILNLGEEVMCQENHYRLIYS